MRGGRHWGEIGSTVAAVVLAMAVGLFVGGVASFTHRQWPISLAGGRLPLGLMVGALIVAATIVGLRLAFHSRVIALGGAAGVLTAVAVLASPGPGGTVVVIQDWVGWTWVLIPAVIAAVTVMWPGRPRTGARRSSADAPSE